MTPALAAVAKNSRAAAVAPLDFRMKSPKPPVHRHSSTCSHGFTVDTLLEQLREEGLRITPGRRRILEVLFEAGKPLSLEEIRKASELDGRIPDFATVFRMVSLLEKLDLVQKVNLQRSLSYFELHDPSKHYDHLVCTVCGKVVVITDPCPLENVEAQLAKRYGFRELSHSLEFFGKCESC